MDLEVLTHVALCGCVPMENTKLLISSVQKRRDEKELLSSSLRSRMHRERGITPLLGSDRSPARFGSSAKSGWLLAMSGCNPGICQSLRNFEIHNFELPPRTRLGTVSPSPFLGFLLVDGAVWCKRSFKRVVSMVHISASPCLGLLSHRIIQARFRKFGIAEYSCSRFDQSGLFRVLNYLQISNPRSIHVDKCLGAEMLDAAEMD